MAAVEAWGRGRQEMVDSGAWHRGGRDTQILVEKGAGSRLPGLRLGARNPESPRGRRGPGMAS